MLNSFEIYKKFDVEAARFEAAVQKKQFEIARNIYGKCIETATFLELDETDMKKLFGNQPYKGKDEEETDGLFTKASVLKTLHVYSGIYDTYRMFDRLLEYILRRR